MTSAQLEGRRVARGADVVLGPGFLRGPAVTHMVKNQATGDRFEIGPREYFVLSRLDGQRTLGEIGDEYAATFQRRLADASWGQLLGLLAAKNLLAGLPDRPAGPAKPARKGFERIGPMRGRYVFGDPSGLVARVYRRISWVYRAPVLGPLLVVLAGMDVWLAAHLPSLVSGLSTLVRQPPLAMVVAVLLWAGAAGHEFAHGLTCRHYGGNASAIGVRWSGPVVAAFCIVDDVMLFPSRRARVATAASGVVANHVFLLPFFALWLALPAHDVTRDAIGALLLLGLGQALFNYLPVPTLDGYHMLAHLLRLSNLAEESRRYTRLRVTALLGRRPGPDGYPRWLRRCYLGFDAWVRLARTAFVVAVVLIAYAVLPVAVASGLTGVLALFIAGRWYAGRKALKKGSAA
ncbi:M50 family metallopeptidase [Dactylosporangium sucinum]|uniref:Peptide zinc metalloprotease protein n=1 Tax=Dactylosporangium sucinum TaxID=1424081 RepID=A0A917TRN8_9ACTN|nr:M50 family metallopeptidase [Dactylosporangium sucinum]GGM34959.1 hypothetical protein GCM10007977_040580 [Dactylosporangium sucinum]